MENILLDGNRVLLADWGSSQTFFAGVPSATFSEKSKSYAPPEVIAHRPYFPPQAECWSLGVTLYAMACGRLPFDRNSPTFATDVATGNFEMPPHVSIRLRSMIHGLLSVDPIIRFSMFGAPIFMVRSSSSSHQIFNTMTSSAAQSFPALPSLPLLPPCILDPLLPCPLPPPVLRCLIKSPHVRVELFPPRRAAPRSAALVTPRGDARDPPHR